MIALHKIGRLPAAEDNCAITTRTLAAGTAVRTRRTHFTLSHTILEGHRFAVRSIPAGAPLLSWNMPFGRALHEIAPGEYVCNEAMLNALSNRALDFELPVSANFADDCAVYRFDPDQFLPALSLPREPGAHTFMGLPRPGKRGVGTRNTIVLLGVNALVGGFVTQLEKEVQPLAKRFENIDDIVAVAHSEGSQVGSNNQELLLRTLAGFMVHPNVGAVLVVDAGDVGVTNEMLRDYAAGQGYELDDVIHGFISSRGPFVEDVARGTAIVSEWLPQVNGMRRIPRPLSELKIALQCGGSDAFSGISGNPLVAWVSKEVIQAGGSAVLAETDELIGAESYVLQKVRDAATVEAFLAMVSRFQRWAAWHGHSAGGNVSGGNLYRGLYNIYLKSLGAATKRHPEVRLDYVAEYGERIDKPGYYFMDSPGNDLESIAGQVASGCNLIFFVTGNGSITNFPFVPTIKIVTTSERYTLLPDEMDVNAGAYLEGTPLAELGPATLNLSLAVASGQRSAGEKAQHAQVQIWRNWQLSGQVESKQIREPPKPSGQPLLIQAPAQIVDVTFSGWQTESGIVSDQVGLLLPSSLCSAQISKMAARRLNELGTGKTQKISRFAAAAHTEGCGSSIQREYVDTMLGYAAHPMVATCLILEHGCEKTHNDFWRQRMQDVGLNPEQFGWASVQLDGGIRPVLAKIEAWFMADCARLSAPQAVTADLSKVRLGIMTEGIVDEKTADTLAQVTQQVATIGGTVVLPANDALAMNRTFRMTLPIDANNSPTIAYAERAVQPGFHLMANPSSQWSETMTGLGAVGVELILALATTRAQQSHPFIHVLQVTAETVGWLQFHADVDVILAGSSRERLEQLLAGITAVLSRTKTPKLDQKHNIGFQITRGPLGVSL
jgi:altronate dehydratase